MAYAYNSSSAYRLESFETVQPKRLNKEDVRVIKTPRQFVSYIITTKTVTVFIMAVTVICLMVYNYVCLNEITGEINGLNKELTKLSSNYVKMQSMCDSTYNPRTMAELAENELGLKRLDKYQTEYIYLYHEDEIEQVETVAKKGLQESVNGMINSASEIIKEYMSAN